LLIINANKWAAAELAAISSFRDVTVSQAASQQSWAFDKRPVGSWCGALCGCAAAARLVVPRAGLVADRRRCDSATCWRAPGVGAWLRRVRHRLHPRRAAGRAFQSHAVRAATAARRLRRGGYSAAATWSHRWCGRWRRAGAVAGSGIAGRHRVNGGQLGRLVVVSTPCRRRIQKRKQKSGRTICCSRQPTRTRR
jgi:hypothetical protein